MRPAGLARAKIRGPGGRELDMVVYEKGDAVSDFVRTKGEWEPDMSSAIIEGLEKAAALLNVSRGEVHFLDVGGNVGVHTVQALAAGFRALTFEPLPQNQPIIRANLCFNDPSRRRGVLFTTGLGAKPARCRAYSATSFNRGNGVVDCEGKVPEHRDAHYGKLELRGELEIARLDDFAGVCDDGRPPAPIGVMKMDVEGFEEQVIEGGKRFLSSARIPFIVLESGRMDFEARRRVLAFFGGLGYLPNARRFSEVQSTDDDQAAENLFLTLVRW